MDDSRLQQTEAALDDARTYLADILEEIPTKGVDAKWLRRARAIINDAIVSVQVVSRKLEP